MNTKLSLYFRFCHVCSLCIWDHGSGWYRAYHIWGLHHGAIHITQRLTYREDHVDIQVSSHGPIHTSVFSTIYRVFFEDEDQSYEDNCKVSAV